MKLKLWDRVFGAIAGLVLLAFSAGLFVFGAGIFPFRLDLSFLDRAYLLWQRAVMVAGAAVLCLLGLRGLSMIFRSNRDRGFILQHTEYGDLSISMSAMENMVKKCVDTHDELKVTSTRISHAREGVIVTIRIALASGVNIPITVSALQKQIKQYITSCSGVDVKEVRVLVETNNNLAPYSGEKLPSAILADIDAATKAGAVVNSLHEAAQNALPVDAVQEEEHKWIPLHQRLFRREEKPMIVPQAPVETPQQAQDVIPEVIPQTHEPETQPWPTETTASPEVDGPHQEPGKEEF